MTELIGGEKKVFDMCAGAGLMSALLRQFNPKLNVVAFDSGEENIAAPASFQVQHQTFHEFVQQTNSKPSADRCGIYILNWPRDALWDDFNQLLSGLRQANALVLVVGSIHGDCFHPGWFHELSQHYDIVCEPVKSISGQPMPLTTMRLSTPVLLAPKNIRLEKTALKAVFGDWRMDIPPFERQLLHQLFPHPYDEGYMPAIIAKVAMGWHPNIPFKKLADKNIAPQTVANIAEHVCSVAFTMPARLKPGYLHLKPLYPQLLALQAQKQGLHCPEEHQLAHQLDVLVEDLPIDYPDTIKCLKDYLIYATDLMSTRLKYHQKDDVYPLLLCHELHTLFQSLTEYPDIKHKADRLYKQYQPAIRAYLSCLPTKAAATSLSMSTIWGSHHAASDPASLSSNPQQILMQ
jgi:hypothetical protein